MSRISREEHANILTHGTGAVLSLAGLCALVLQALRHGSTLQLLSFTVFGVSLVLVYVSSTLLHRYQTTRLELLDHVSIYLLIAGTQTPFLLVTLHNQSSLTLLTAVWALALIGIVLKIVYFPRGLAYSVLLYAAVGWMILFAIRPLQERLHPAGFELLLIGGLLYMLGVIFYLWRRVPYHHAIWHLFVMAGSAAHYAAVFRYVLPIR